MLLCRTSIPALWGPFSLQVALDERVVRARHTLGCVLMSDDSFVT